MGISKTQPKVIGQSTLSSFLFLLHLYSCKKAQQEWLLLHDVPPLLHHNESQSFGEKKIEALPISPASQIPCRIS